MKIFDKIRNISPGMVFALGVAFVLGGMAIAGVSLVGLWAGYSPYWKVMKSDLSELPETILRRWETQSQIPTIRIDIKFRHFEKLRKKREEAKSIGVLISENSDYVPALISNGNQKFPVKIRLKGDGTPHFIGPKWSIRVKTKNGQSFMGMRRFSMREPFTRPPYPQGEAMFFAHLRKEGILAPRYFNANVIVNGSTTGIMAVEEFFSTQFFESRGRRGAVVVRFDATALWENARSIRVYWPFLDHRNSPIQAMSEQSILADPSKAKQYAIAHGLLRGFMEGSLKRSEVFDVEKFAKFFALTELWGAKHGLEADDIRFLFNPISQRLEPIGYDSRPGGYVEDFWYLTIQSRFNPLQDAQIKEAFLKHLKRISKYVLEGTIDNILVDENDKLTHEIRINNAITRRFPAEYVRRHAAVYVDATEADARVGRGGTPLALGKKFGAIAYMFVSKGVDGNYIEFRNIMPRPVIVDNIEIAGGGSVNNILAKPIDTPIQLLPAVEQNIWPRFLIRRDVDVSNLEIIAKARMPRHKHEYAMRSKPYFVAAKFRPFAKGAGNGSLKSREFLDTSGLPDSVVTRQGNWIVNETLVIPRSVTWRLEAGAKLRFGPDARVIVRGRILAEGEPRKPIIFAASDKSWKGIQVIQGSAQSEFKHIEFLNIDRSPISFPGLTGAVTVYETPVLMNNVSFRDINAEDALNIINGTFDVSDVSFNAVRSDAIDVDFSKGKISGGYFETVGGDGVDTSGSTVSLKSLEFNGISDKALSVGEKSNVTAENIVIRDAAIGIVSKDLSVLKVRHAKIGDISKYGLMAYQKKSSYGAARLIADSIEFGKGNMSALAQTGSEILIDGKPVPTRELDVQALYSEPFPQK